MEQIGVYRQLTPFTNLSAGMAEWCKAEKDGNLYFIKKMQSPVYPSRDLGLPEKKYRSRITKFHAELQKKADLYRRLQKNNTSGTLVVPEDILNYQYHICTVAEFRTGNLKPEQVCKLSGWQRLVLMRTLTLALMNVHQAGIVHSDIKPENVIITQDPENGSCALKLIDFDGSFPVSDPPETIPGDPAYFAPEVYAASMDPRIRVDASMDVFALGLVLHYFWTGDLPSADSAGTIGQNILRGSRIHLAPSVPSGLKDIIRRTLTADPRKRISLETIYSELGDLLSQYPVLVVNLQKKYTTAPAAAKPAAAKPAPEAAKPVPAAEKPVPPAAKKSTVEVDWFETLIGLLILIFLAVRFPDKIPFTQANYYQKAVSYYQDGNYEKAEERFEKVKDKEYKDTSLYLDFCRMHTSGKPDYDTLLKHLDFEDAKALLADDDAIFCRFMKGDWEYYADSTSYTVTMTNEENLIGFPELSNGETFRIKGGRLQTRKTTNELWSDRFEIEITGRNSIRFTSSASRKSYYFSRTSTLV